MSLHQSRAIVLNLVEFSESSYIVTLFTEDFGKISAMAKGARRRTSSFASALDLLSICRVVFIPKSSDVLALLTEAALEKPFRSSLRCLKRLYAGYYVAEFTAAITEDRDPNPELFRILLRALNSLDKDGSISAELIRFELRAIKVLGHLPLLRACSECGVEVTDESRVPFSPMAGGVLCPECRVGKRHVISVSRQAINALQAIADESCTSEMEQRSTDREVTGEMRSVMNRYICHLLGRRPRLFEFLGYA
jgi:DNA repair protein RecO (recombination protein O)